jgi:hypothetical protein
VEKWLADSIPAEELERIATEGVSPSGLLAPFHDALVPGITLLGERSFSTRLGNLHERIAAAVATEAHAEVHQPTTSRGQSPFCRVSSLLSALAHSSTDRLNPTPNTSRGSRSRLCALVIGSTTQARTSPAAHRHRRAPAAAVHTLRQDRPGRHHARTKIRHPVRVNRVQPIPVRRLQPPPELRGT